MRSITEWLLGQIRRYVALKLQSPISNYCSSSQIACMLHEYAKGCYSKLNDGRRSKKMSRAF